MTALTVFILTIVAALLTLWLLVIPAEVVVGALRALRRGGWRRVRR